MNPQSDHPGAGNDARRQRGSSSAAPSGASDSENGGSAPSSTDTMVKKMVRLALASEYARLPIRRSDISAKVLGEQGARQFKTVFELAQRELRQHFGMEMTELPAREKVTITQRRAAQKTEKPSSTNKSWMLTTTLPQGYRTPTILTPTRAPSSATESTYTALYSFIIGVISLNGGSLAEQKLDRYLARTNADTYTPIDKTDKLLQRLCREGYLVRTREMDGGEEVVEYMVGPRGKVEVGASGVAGMVKRVYGRDGGDGNRELAQWEIEENEEFENRLKRSLGVVDLRRDHAEEESALDGGAAANGTGNETGHGVEDARRQSQSRRSSRRSSRRATTGAREESSSEEDESEDEDDSD
ncbi:hypothetical protein N7474_004001 [Penicillium riverlandense]|uniref:uncharacterized protein n=1 Tax=Penicillium riverlandense TaxID=1903569 RepID=UPI0025485E48|nr:uncharacterized protein N7474_004001 [Penicillium riverlandense]KAJ5818410.1 hypothetical protein N7474_004001 [Penicillium riverlandense]